jgi:acetyltransferase-like isoleucine patch superfamily enzyme
VAYGVTIGSGCLIGANSAVTKDIPDGTMAGGVPAQIKGPVKQQEPDLMSRFGKVE